ncbi:hypothetical protein TSUD_391020 [Trifolium subterraneum]|uniref:RING-type domain-containing protein n=1 Tax=Trifolium subterraneum TaxID=3900 RepID=A0A2Z6M2U7_TRISU|nr:hypothetical protein TSUD_391020 [Trifolium subterraneum]
MNKSKKSKPQPKNTFLLTSNVEGWKRELKIYEEEQNLKVLYAESGGGKINFHSHDIVVSSILDLKLPINKNDRFLTSIQGHQWHRLIIDKVDIADNDAMNFILKLKVVNKWILGEEGEEGIPLSQTQTDFVFGLLFGSAMEVSLSRKNEVLKANTLKRNYLYGFGSKVIQTISIELTNEEKEPYMEAENWVKEQFRTTAELKNDEQLRNLQYLELSIIKLREMVSHLSLRVRKEGNIEACAKAAKKLQDLQPNEICTICQFNCKIIKIVTKCGHVFCETCWSKWFHEEKKCGVCNSEVNDDDFFSTPFNCPSSKAIELVNLLNTETSRTSSSIVISSFESFLPWLEIFLREHRFNVHRVTNDTSVEDRQVLQHPTKGMVLLASIQWLISRNIDISALDQVYFMEAMKKRVENRIISQLGINTTRMFKGFRLIVKDTIETRIVELNGTKPPEFKEFNVEEVNRILM